MASTTRNRKPLVSNASGTHSSGSDSDASGVSQFDPQVNEQLATEIQRELWFRVRQIPSKITRSIGPVALCCEFCLGVHSDTILNVRHSALFVGRAYLCEPLWYIWVLDDDFSC